MPQDNPAAYDQMSDEELEASLQEQLGAIGSLAEGLPEEGAEVATDAVAEELPMEEVIEEAPAGSASPEEAVAALGEILSQGPATPGEVLELLQERGFDIVKSAPMEEEVEMDISAPLSELRGPAIEKALGGAL